MQEPLISEIFSLDGPLAAMSPGFRVRTTQIELAQAVERTIAERSTLIAEAGTGTGKTWAYLVPALLGGGKVLVSTGTRTLQDQLFSRDLPRVREALSIPATIALLKGRGNYVCHYHLERLQGEDRALKSRGEVHQLRNIQTFAQQSATGDRADLPTVPEDAEIWQRVTSTRENCLGQDCPNVRDCFVLKARRQAQEADVVVINHALFMADLMLREEGVTDLLPAADTVVFDEAHQLPDTATRFLGSSVSTHQLLDLGRLIETAGLAHARELTNWSEQARALEQATRELRLSCAALENMPSRRVTFEAFPEPAAFDIARKALQTSLDAVGQLLASVEEKHPDLATAARTARELSERLAEWGQPARGLRSDAQDLHQIVRWVELGLHHVRLHAAPLSVAEAFSRYRQGGQAWIFTSATLSVHGDFSHFTERLGLQNAETVRMESPFDYAKQAMLFVPQSLPVPQSSEFLPAFVEQLMPLIQASQGGALVLCTTLRAVERVAALLADAYDRMGLSWPIMRQGNGTRRDLLERFRTLDHAVLVGSASFWEGIDVAGDRLTLVAIDKLPFAPPDDPVLEARLRACRSRGGNPFMEYQLPEAAIALKQGAGRLIRSETDWGVLMVGDTRLVDKPYGKQLWRGLPPFARTRVLEEAVEFLTLKQA
ncbi:ATP-dependent DNA helicase [Alcaligenaceae bacterium LF4-65]|uniref:ATP-dependent DNA helicase n=1 Tax=Zwartia hollandica TaxID=324606 RepID=A0A953NEK9_9BURK|nr:ATP-dependent DNA helicase [Zwartia hollandica]MBZ1351930.1 ATP-dependent DNA helicase [Zwartia hollandica]